MSTQSNKRPHKEQQFFEDTAIDRLMGTVMALATELFVLRNRVCALQNQVAKSGMLDIAALNESGTPDECAASKTDAKEFSEALLKPLLGLQEADGPPD